MNFGDIPENVFGNVSAFCRSGDLSRLSSCSKRLYTVVFGASLALFFDVFRLTVDGTFVVLPKVRKDVYRLLERSRQYNIVQNSSEVILFACGMFCERICGSSLACGYTEFLQEYLSHFSVKQLCELLLIPDASGMHPLQLAAFNGHRDTVDLLLSKKASVDHFDEHGRTAFWYACRGAHLSVMAFLLMKDCDVFRDPSCLIACINSVSRHFQDMVQCTQFLSLHFVSHLEVPRVQNLLIEAVSEAISKSSELLGALLKPFIECGYICEMRRSHPNLNKILIAAVRSNMLDIVDPLITSGLSQWSDCCTSRKSALFVACEMGNLAMTEKLLTLKCPINILTSTQRNALHIAVERGHCEIVQRLCEYATMDDILQPNSSDVTPFTLAENRGRLGMILAMLNVYHRFKETACMSAVYVPKMYLDKMVLKYSRPRTAATRKPLAC